MNSPNTSTRTVARHPGSAAEPDEPYEAMCRECHNTFWRFPGELITQRTMCRYCLDLGKARTPLRKAAPRVPAGPACAAPGVLTRPVVYVPLLLAPCAVVILIMAVLISVIGPV